MSRNEPDDACESPPTEACCLSDGSCDEIDSYECYSRQGTPLGRDSVCLGDPDGNGTDEACEERPAIEIGLGS